MCDGWDDAARNPLMNCVAHTADGQKFLCAINTTGREKTAEYIAQELMRQIDEIGRDKVVQVLNCVSCLTSQSNRY